MQHNWYAVLTAKVLMDKRLSSTQKLLVALISNLQNEKGYCFASNKYLGDCLDISERQIQQNIHELEDHGILNRVVKLDKSGDVELRALTVLEVAPMQKTSGGYAKNNTPPPCRKLHHNNKQY